MAETIRLGVNVDHVATLRQARGTPYPDPVEGALLAAASGADSITIHLREDRRHIQEHDLKRLLACSPVPVNLEMAVTPQMLDLACRYRPHYVCLVPERREERTTEGGLDVAGNSKEIAKACRKLAEADIAAALFIDSRKWQLDAAIDVGVPHIEIHTGRYADEIKPRLRDDELEAIALGALNAARAGIEVHAGHGLTVENVGPIAAIPEIVELNIGHSLIARAVFIGLPAAIAEMRRAMSETRRLSPPVSRLP